MPKKATQAAPAAEPSAPKEAWRSRIVSQTMEDPSTLRPHPENWREHPDAQGQALEQVLDEIGWVQTVLVSNRSGCLLDGHLRIERALARGEKLVPVTRVDVAEEEELVILSSLDPIAALAKTNQAKLKGVLDRVRACWA